MGGKRSPANMDASICLSGVCQHSPVWIKYILPVKYLYTNVFKISTLSTFTFFIKYIVFVNDVCTVFQGYVFWQHLPFFYVHFLSVIFIKFQSYAIRLFVVWLNKCNKPTNKQLLIKLTVRWSSQQTNNEKRKK